MSSHRRLLATPVAVTLLVLGSGCGGYSGPDQGPDCSSVADTTQPATVSYQNDVFPMFSSEQLRCMAAGCHGGGLASSGYSLASHAETLEQGDEAGLLKVCEVKPGDPDRSYLVWKIEGDPRIKNGTVRMPNGCEITPDPNDCLSAAQIDTIRTWILEGARNN